MTLHTGHTGLNVTDLDRSLAFYRDLLGFTLLAEGTEDDRRYAFLGDGGDRPVLTLWQQAQGSYDRGRAGLHHLAFTADSIDRVREYEAALRAAGTDFAHDGVVAPPGGRGLRRDLLPRPGRHPPGDLRPARRRDRPPPPRLRPDLRLLLAMSVYHAGSRAVQDQAGVRDPRRPRGPLPGPGHQARRRGVPGAAATAGGGRGGPGDGQGVGVGPHGEAGVRPGDGPQADIRALFR